MIEQGGFCVGISCSDCCLGEIGHCLGNTIISPQDFFKSRMIKANELLKMEREDKLKRILNEKQ